MPDPLFENRRLAEIYDPMDPDRSDLEVYAAMVGEFGAQTVLDIGCGTGTFALMLAAHGVEVIGVDPAGASLDVAKGKSGSDAVRWLHCDATTLPALQVDLATMTANVAQVFVTDDDWSATLRGVHAALKPGGRLVFETRDPARKSWLEWGREHSHATVDLPGIGGVETWCDVLEVTGALVTFRWTNIFASDGEVITSDSTLRFRDRDELKKSLHDNGFAVDEVRDAPDRPGREFVFVATRPD
ncbi:MAG: class I SAM-dependent methyltransferase [Actinomycetota bacterium]|nr:class I SAM-dependent methyltransferase [Actinomycetota bacterium]